MTVFLSIFSALFQGVGMMWENLANKPVVWINKISGAIIAGFGITALIP